MGTNVKYFCYLFISGLIINAFVRCLRRGYRIEIYALTLLRPVRWAPNTSPSLSGIQHINHQHIIHFTLNTNVEGRPLYFSTFWQWQACSFSHVLAIRASCCHYKHNKNGKSSCLCFFHPLLLLDWSCSRVLKCN